MTRQREFNSAEYTYITREHELYNNVYMLSMYDVYQLCVNVTRFIAVALRSVCQARRRRLHVGRFAEQRQGGLREDGHIRSVDHRKPEHR